MTTYVYDTITATYVLPSELSPTAGFLDGSGNDQLAAYMWTCENTVPCVLGDGVLRTSTPVYLGQQVNFSTESDPSDLLTPEVLANMGEAFAAGLVLVVMFWGLGFGAGLILNAIRNH